MSHDNPAIIIDLGSGSVKAGFSGEPGPRVVFPNLVGRPKAPGIMVGAAQREFHVGAAAEMYRGVLNLKSPVSHGVVEDWEDLQKVLEHTFQDQLGVDPAGYNVMITEPPLNPKSHRERMTQLLFDSFGVGGLYIGISAVLTLYHVGAFTGLVVDIGDAVTHFVPIFDGYPLPHSILRIDLAGQDVSQYLRKLLYARGVHLSSSSADLAALRGAKESACYVAQDFEEATRAAEAGACEEVEVPLPDGGVLRLGAERFRAPELLFRPSLMDRTFGGLAELAFQSIMKSDVDVRKDLFQRIIVCGGSSRFPGLRERLEREVQRLAPRAVSSLVRCLDAPTGSDSAWLGGSVLSTQSTFGTMWVTKDEYEDAGPTIVHRKCF